MLHNHLKSAFVGIYMTGNIALFLIAAYKPCNAASIRDGMMPPTLNLSESDPECDLGYIRNMHWAPNLQRVLGNSFGFGGKNVVLALAQIEGSLQ